MAAITFLIADPTAGVQHFMQKLLENNGFDPTGIKTASTSQEALEIAETLKPDFLLTDWFANEAVTGIDLFHSIKKTNPYCHFALLSSDITSVQEQEAQDAGALFLLAKPFTVDEIRSELRRAMDQAVKAHPRLAAHVQAQTQATQKTTTMQPQNMPQYKPGDQVLYLNRVETIKHVILRRGELVVQLQGMSGFIEATRIKHR